MYAEGKGVAQSDEEAVQWWQKAADHECGHALAQLNLGVVLFLAIGVPKDLGASHKYLTLAAAQGDGSGEQAITSCKAHFR